MTEILPNYISPEYEPRQDFIRVAIATPEVSVGNVDANVEQISSLYSQACEKDVSVLVTPELSITGYTLGDTVQSQQLLLDAKDGLEKLAKLTTTSDCALVVGFPFESGNALYNCAALLAKGSICGIVPKKSLPNYKEFYEKRWFQGWNDDSIVEEKIGEQIVPFGSHQLFEIDNRLIGIEICEDLWDSNSPNVELAANGATLILNPSASPEIASKQAYRRNLVAVTSGKLACAYAYAGADSSESTMDIVMSGHGLICEAGKVIAERKPFSSADSRLLITDVDVAHLNYERRMNTNFPNNRTMQRNAVEITPSQTDIQRRYDKYPFIPGGNRADIAERLEEIITIQSVGLAERMKHTGLKHIVLGLSGGLDSTLALLIAASAATRLGLETSAIHTISMPSKANSERTKSNADKLAASLKTEHTVIPITELTKDQLTALEHSGQEDTTFENVQARTRTGLLFNYANQLNALVLGTGDLSEIALGWCTFNADHMSHYNVNASVPKTLVKHLVAQAASNQSLDCQVIVNDILDTPISPELTGNGELLQETESIVGPYILHDFFLYHFIRYQESAEKILYLAEQTFDEFTSDEIQYWLAMFISRFYRNQWKRSVMPDGPKVGSVSLSPRGDWRMPSDAADGAKRHLQKIGVI